MNEAGYPTPRYDDGVRRARYLVVCFAAALAACASPLRQVPDAQRLTESEVAAYRDAAAAMDDGDPARALRAIEPVAAHEPWHVPSHVLRQDALALTGGEAQAKSWYASEAAERPTDAARALLAARVGPRDGGARESAYREAAAREETATWARIALGYELVRRARDDLARATKFGDDGFIAAAAAALQSRTDAYAEAEKTARAVALARPDLAAAQAALADVLLAITNDTPRNLAPDAVRAAEAALALDVGSAAAWARAGRARRAKTEDAAAATAFERAVEIAPKNAGYRASWGRVLLDLRRDGDARDVLGHAARLDPNDEATAVNYALSLFRTKDLSAAETEFVRATRLDPSDPRAFNGLALTRAERDDRAGAADAMEKYLAVGGADRDAARRFIDEMRGAGKP